MKKHALVLISLFAIFLSSCITLRVETKINRDGSGTHSIAFAFDKEMMEEVGGSPEDMLSGADLPAEGMPGVSIEEYSERDAEGYKITYSFKSLEEFKTMYDGQAAEMFESLTLNQEADTWTFRAVFASDMAGLDQGMIQDLEGMDLEEVGIKASYAIQVDGKVLSYSPKQGAKVKGNKVTWDLVDTPSDAQELMVQWGEGSATNTTTLLLVGIAAGGVILAVAGAIMSMRGKPAANQF